MKTTKWTPERINERLAQLSYDPNARVLLALRKAGHVNGGNCAHCKAKREAAK